MRKTLPVLGLITLLPLAACGINSPRPVAAPDCPLPPQPPADLMEPMQSPDWETLFKDAIKQSFDSAPSSNGSEKPVEVGH